MKPIQITGLKKRYGSTEVLNHLNLTVEPGEIVAIIGESGCGKTTLMRCIELLEKPDAGEILIDGEAITAKGAKVDKIRRSMGMVYQNFNLFTHLNVMDNLSLAPVKLMGMKRADAEKKAEQLLGQVGLHGRGRQMPGQLSGGQKQRVAIARCLMMDPGIMLFDEPTSALDPSMTGEVLATMRMLAKQGMTMLIVTHEMKLAREIATRVLFMADRGIYEEGTPEQIFDHPRGEKTIAFVRKLKHFSYRITEKEVDFMELMGGIEAFSERYGLQQKAIRRLQLLTEELVRLLLSNSEGKSVDIELSIELSQDDGSVSLSAVSAGPRHNPFEGSGANEEGDRLEWLILKNMSKGVIHSYENGLNLIKIDL